LWVCSSVPDKCLSSCARGACWSCMSVSRMAGTAWAHAGRWHGLGTCSAAQARPPAARRSLPELQKAGMQP